MAMAFISYISWFDVMGLAISKHLTARTERGALPRWRLALAEEEEEEKGVSSKKEV